MKPGTLLSTNDIVDILKHKLFVKDEHIQFLKSIGGTFKIRQFYFEVVMFDLLYDTRTSDFLPEELYLRLAKENPNSFANPFHVTHGVKYRGSLTSSIVYGLTEAICILQNNGIKPNTASLFDLGCGAGKPLLIGMRRQVPFYKQAGQINPPFSFFKRAIGIDYYKPLLDIARQNIKSVRLGLHDQDITFECTDAAEFRSFSGVNVVYIYNPFDAEVMIEVEKNLRKYAYGSIIIYNKPIHREVFESKGWRKKSESIGNDPDSHIVIFTDKF